MAPLAYEISKIVPSVRGWFCKISYFVVSSGGMHLFHDKETKYKIYFVVLYPLHILYVHYYQPGKETEIHVSFDVDFFFVCTKKNPLSLVQPSSFYLVFFFTVSRSCSPTISKNVQPYRYEYFCTICPRISKRPG